LQEAVPLVVAAQSSRNGGDGGWVRLHSVTSSEGKFVIDEDTACDTERMHTTEQVSVLAWSKAFVLSK